jgi:hypothetical protein
MTLAVINGRKGGRPVKLTKTLATEIAATLSQSPKSLIQLCKENTHWLDYWTLTQEVRRKPWFGQMIWRAREEQADTIAQQTLDVARDTLGAQNMAEVQAAKLVCENTRWYAGKVLKRLYGDDQTVNVDARTAVVVSDDKLKELRSRLDEARSLIKGKNDVSPSGSVTNSDTSA